MLSKRKKNQLLQSVDLRHAVKNFKNLYEDYNFLKENNIRIIPQLTDFTDEIITQISELEKMRNKVSNQIRRPKSAEEQIENKKRRKEITKQIQPLRKKLRMAERILEKSPHLYELFKTELALEKAAQNRYLER